MAESGAVFDNSSTSASPSNRFYRTVWRWHFYAGMLITPIMIILAITGIIYLFKPQLDRVMYHDLLVVQPTATTLAYSEQIQSVERAYPDATVTEVTPYSSPDRSTEVLLKTAEARSVMVFVNPHTGEVLGSRDEENNLQAIARKIHGDLLIGKSGDYLVELAACWGLVLLLSGVYLWMPRRQFSALGTFVPRLWSQNKRIFWRDLHAVPGLYATLLIGFLILTGLPWTGFWGDTFAQIWGTFPAQMWDDVPQSTVLTGSLNNHQRQVVPWAVEQVPIPHSTVAALVSGDSNLLNRTDSAVYSENTLASTPATIDSVIALARANNAPSSFNVVLPQDETGVYTVSAFPPDPTQEVTMHIDRYSGKVLADVRWSDYGFVPKAVELGISIHMGKFFGLANQLLMLFASSVLILLSVTGVVMWWQRRPKKSVAIGAPPMPKHVQSWRVPVAIIAVLGLIFPLVGLSLVVVLLLDYLVLSRIPALRHIFN